MSWPNLSHVGAIKPSYSQENHKHALKTYEQKPCDLFNSLNKHTALS